MTYYEEKIRLHPIVIVSFLILVAVLIWSIFAPVRPTWALILITILLASIPLLFGRLLVRVDEEELVVSFGYLNWPRQVIPLLSVLRSRSVQYRPIINFGGWGCRVGRLNGEWTSVYSLRGSSGLLLELTEERRICGIRTRRFLIGCREPERFEAVMKR